MPPTEKNYLPGSRQVNFRLDGAAVQLLDMLVPPNTHRRGPFVSRLIFEFAARLEERQRLGALRTDDDVPPW